MLGNNVRQMGKVFDLGGKKISDLSVKEFYNLCHEVFVHGVICIKNQNLDVYSDYVSSLYRLGDAQLMRGLFGKECFEQGLDQIFRVGNINQDGTIKKGFKFAEYWHQDGDMWGHPQNYIVNWLLANKLPQIGGETAFFDCVGAINYLDQGLKEKLQKAIFNLKIPEIPDFKNINVKDYGLPELITHKIIYNHLITNQPHLYLGYESNKIEFEDGSEMNVNTLLSVLEQYRNLFYVHKYEDGDLILWDNVSTLHKSLGGYFDEPRLLFRGQSYMSSYHIELIKKIISI